MKVNEKVRGQVVEFLEKNRMKLADKCRQLECDMAEAITVEALISLKQRYLQALIAAFPMYGDSCYFCVARRALSPTCRECPYGKVHGFCNDQESEWRKLKNIVGEVKCCIMDYYKDEIYPEED